MSRKTVTVFVRRIGAQFHASTHEADGFAASATIAARKAAARHFRVEESEVELREDRMFSGVVDASVKTRAMGPNWNLLLASLICTVLAVGTVLIFMGGAL